MRTVKCLQWTFWHQPSISLDPCSWRMFETAGRSRTSNQIIYTSGWRTVPHVNLESCRMAQILHPDTPQPWLEAFSLRAGIRAEERGLAMDWFSSLALACIPRFRRPRSSHWLRGHAGYSSILSCCCCHGLFQLKTHYFSFTLDKKIIVTNNLVSYWDMRHNKNNIKIMIWYKEAHKSL